MEGVHPNSLSKWRKDQKFVELLEMVKAGKQTTTKGMSDAANKVLWEMLEAEDPVVRLRAALHIKKLIPNEPVTRLLVRNLKPVHKKELKQDVAVRIQEEMDEDKSRKTDKIPVPHVGRTQKSGKRKEPKEDIIDVFEFEEDKEFDPETYWGE